MGTRSIECSAQRKNWVQVFLLGGTAILFMTELDGELGDHHDDPMKRRSHGFSLYLSMWEFRGHLSDVYRIAIFALVMISIAAVSSSRRALFAALLLTLTSQAVQLALMSQPRRSSKRNAASAISSKRNEQTAPMSNGIDGVRFVKQNRRRLTWEQFASLHACQFQQEPALIKSLEPYRTNACNISIQQIRRAVSRPIRGPGGMSGLSIKDNKVRVFGLPPTDPPRLWDWLLPDLQFISEQVDLPDVEFAVWFGDNAHFNANTCFPVFVQEKEASSGGVYAPPRSATGMVRGMDMGLGTLHAAKIDPAAFECKEQKAFFRGSNTGGHDNWRTSQRSKVVQLSLVRPDLLDARFVFSDASKASALYADMLRAGFVGDYVSHDEQVRRYKMIVVPDGNSVPDRLMSMLAEDVVVLKPQSSVEEYWYSELVPFEHFIPFKRDVSDLEDVIDRSLRNKTLLRHVATQSTLFVLRRLNPRTISCYWVQLLREYSTLFTSDNGTWSQQVNVEYYASKEDFHAKRKV